MSPRLIFLNGPPAAGKTTVARLLFERLPHCAWLDGDDVWRIRPFEVNDATRALVERNIPFVLRGYLDAGYSAVILSWVMHRQEIIDLILAALGDADYELAVFTLVCTEAELRQRLDRERDVAAEHALERLRQARVLSTTQIDTTGRAPSDVADEIRSRLGPLR